MPHPKSLPDEPNGSPSVPTDLAAPSPGLAYTPLTDLAAPPHRMAYTAAEVGFLLNLGRSKTLALIADGTIPSVKIDRARRIRHSDLVRYVGDQRKPGFGINEYWVLGLGLSLGW